jgi:3-oxoacyl-[acyl-carrier protein] reductase
MKPFSSCKAYVSASSRGLAFDIAKRLAREGVAVALSSRDAAHLNAARDRILREVPGAVVVTLQGDLSVRTDQQRILDELGERDFLPDIFVCSSGQPPDVQIPSLCRQRWDYDVEMILGQATFAAQRFAPEMARRNYGRVLFISSTVAKMPGRHFLTSSVTRAGLVALSKAMVEEYGSSGVATFVLCLGYVDTPLLRNMALGREFDAPDPALEAEVQLKWKTRYEEWSKKIPAGRVGKTEELADLVLFLASPAAEYLSGSVLDFAGGLGSGAL